ncbi:MAG: hypothetical protein DRP27_07730, partial [Thermotogae bacterium]
ILKATSQVSGKSFNELVKELAQSNPSALILKEPPLGERVGGRKEGRRLTDSQMNMPYKIIPTAENFNKLLMGYNPFYYKGLEKFGKDWNKPIPVVTDVFRSTKIETNWHHIDQKDDKVALIPKDLHQSRNYQKQLHPNIRERSKIDRSKFKAQRKRLNISLARKFLRQES